MNIYTMNPDGTNLQNLTPINKGTGYNSEPAYSPNSKKIAFASNQNEDRILGIYTMNADGTNQTNVSNNAGPSRSPGWQSITAPINSAPTITGLRPPPGSSTTDRTPIIAATVTDRQTNLAKSNITLVLDDVTIPRTAFSYNRSTDRMLYTPANELSLGKHALKVIARDGSGLSTTKRWSFTIEYP